MPQSLFKPALELLERELLFIADLGLSEYFLTVGEVNGPARFMWWASPSRRVGFRVSQTKRDAPA
jgi:hypothetical protein